MYSEELDIIKVKRVIEGILNIEVEIKRVEEGISTFVYQIKVNNEITYLRILPEINSNFNAEITVLKLLRDKGVMVPEVIYYDKRNKDLGLSLMIIDEIKGLSIESKLPFNYEDILYKAGKDLAIINSVNVDGYGWVKDELTGEHNTFKDYFLEHLNNDLDKLSSYGFIDNEISMISKYLNMLLTNNKSYLSHGDFDISHIFYLNDYTGIIDFGEIMGTSRFYDLGHFRLHDMQYYDKEGFKSIIKGYNEVYKLNSDDLFEIELWALFIGVRRLGMIYGRDIPTYSNFLINKVKEIIKRISK